jgi:hypothetical protein
MNKEYTITKRIAKHGTQSVIIIPSILQNEIRPNTPVEVRITVINQEYKNII